MPAASNSPWRSRKEWGMSLDRDQQCVLHRAVLRDEPTPRLAEALLEPLVDRLRYGWRRTPNDVLYEQAAASVMSYLKPPHRYDPDRSALLSPLYTDATGDLRNVHAAASAGARLS